MDTLNDLAAILPDASFYSRVARPLALSTGMVETLIRRAVAADPFAEFQAPEAVYAYHRDRIIKALNR